MATIKWKAPGSTTTILTTELNSLGAGSNKLSAALSNDAAGELDLFADFELFVSTTSARAAGSYFALYILEELDGTNYGFGGDSLDPPASAWVGNFPIDAATATRYIHLREVPLPPTDFKVLIINNMDVAMAATANTLKFARYNYESA